jgi:hypothetical protein
MRRARKLGGIRNELDIGKKGEGKGVDETNLS